jgi:hypothetical protein
VETIPRFLTSILNWKILIDWALLMSVGELRQDYFVQEKFFPQNSSELVEEQTAKKGMKK